MSWRSLSLALLHGDWARRPSGGKTAASGTRRLSKARVWQRQGSIATSLWQDDQQGGEQQFFSAGLYKAGTCRDPPLGKLCSNTGGRASGFLGLVRWSPHQDNGKWTDLLFRKAASTTRGSFLKQGGRREAWGETPTSQHHGMYALRGRANLLIPNFSARGFIERVGCNQSPQNH